MAVQGTRLFENVLSTVRRFAVDSLNDEEIYRRAAAGVIDELGDDYAELLLPGERGAPAGESAPQGLYLDRRDGLVVVVGTVPGSPADSAGVRAGDRLLAIDSARAEPTRLGAAARLLDGKAGSTVRLRLRRGDARAPVVVDLVRGPVKWPPAVEATALGGGVGRVRVQRIVPGLADSVRAAVSFLRLKGVRAIALDLRGTVGGGVTDGAALAELFLGAGQTAAFAKARQASGTQRFAATLPAAFDSLPVAVLVDAGTAGAAEVVAGALQDHDRAAVLGSISFGRGVTQSLFSLGAGVSLRLTTAVWETPSGRRIQWPPPPANGDSLPPRPKLRSDGGRVLLGGGGIVPDRLVTSSGPEDAVLAEARSLLSRAGSTRAVLALVADTTAH
jgi:carboxyl-terminal processing protease